MIDALCAAPQQPLPSSPVVLMVSGGSDSTALLLHAATGELDLFDGRGPVRLDCARLHVLHVNHCLRGAASDGDEAFVRDLCARLGVACTVRRIDIPSLLAGGANREETARRERYAAAWELAGSLAAAAGVPRETARICVGHTADDRAETFLMRVLTGAGPQGLTGMRATRGVVARPLIDRSREDLRACLRERGQNWREDATNAEDAALRSYVRMRVMPGFVDRNPSFAQVLGSTLDILADESDLLERLAARELDALRAPGAPGVLALDAARLAHCEPALARRALRRVLADFLGEEGMRAARLEARHVEALLGLARSGAGSCTLPLGVDARVCRGVLAVSLPPAWPLGDGRGPGEPVGGALAVPGALAWGDATLEARPVPVPAGRLGDAVAFARERARVLSDTRGWVEGRDFVLVDAACVRDGLHVGPPCEGERMQPLGLGGSKLVSDVLRDAGVPLRARPHVPVVRAGDGSCVWVGGICLDARAAYSQQTEVLVELNFLRH